MFCSAPQCCQSQVVCSTQSSNILKISRLIGFASQSAQSTQQQQRQQHMTSVRRSTEASAAQSQEPVIHAPEGFQQVLFVEAGTGADQHGQNATKAAVRACRNAIEFNSLPAIRQLVPGGYNGLKLRVKIGVPDPETVDVGEVRKVFPYGRAEFEIVDGGLRASSGIAISELGDKNDEWYIAVAAVTVGY